MATAEQLADFLDNAGWADALVENMESDFSPRRFTRLHHKKKDKTVILMEADGQQKTNEFVVIAWLLRGLNLSTPEIYSERRKQGLVLMEDFGEGNVGRLIDGGRYDNSDFYVRAASVLSHLHQNFVKTSVNDLHLPRYTSALFTKQAEKYMESYVPYMLQRKATEEESAKFHAAWLEALKPVDSLPQTLILRDFMPDNVMDLPDRKAWRSLGLLDFQDAGIGPNVYDLVSFCEVVRRDGGDVHQRRMLTLYFEQMKPACTWEALQRAGTVLAAQRHTRILGILGTLAQKDPSSTKLSYLPRVRDYVKYLLGDPALKAVRDSMEIALDK